MVDLCWLRPKHLEVFVGTTDLRLFHLSFLLLLIRYLPMGAFNSSDRSREPKVTELDSAIFVDEHVCRFQVSVEHVSRVDIVDSTDQVVSDCLDVKHLQMDG